MKIKKQNEKLQSPRRDISILHPESCLLSRFSLGGFPLRQRFLKFVEKKWIQNNHNLKDISCVYVLAGYHVYNAKLSEILYVGSTTILASRYRSHKVPSKIQKLDYMSILYYIPMQTGFYDYERKLIKKLQPNFNKQHR